MGSAVMVLQKNLLVRTGRIHLQSRQTCALRLPVLSPYYLDTGTRVLSRSSGEGIV